MASSTVVARKVITVETKDHPQVSSGSGDPSSTPRAVGDFYVDTAAATLWVGVTDLSAAPPAPRRWVHTSGSYSVRNVSTATTTLTRADGTVLLDNASESRIVTLPRIADLGEHKNQKRFTIVDSAGTAESYNITILPHDDDTVSGEGYTSIITDCGSVQLFCVGDTQWFVGAPS